MEDGEINGGFLGDEEMQERKALASAHGEGTNMSWVEAVLIGTGQVKASDFPNATEARGHESAEDPDPAAAIPVSCIAFAFAVLFWTAYLATSAPLHAVS